MFWNSSGRWYFVQSWRLFRRPADRRCCINAGSGRWSADKIPDRHEMVDEYFFQWIEIMIQFFWAFGPKLWFSFFELLGAWKNFVYYQFFKSFHNWKRIFKHVKRSFPWMEEGLRDPWIFLQLFRFHFEDFCIGENKAFFLVLGGCVHSKNLHWYRKKLVMEFKKLCIDQFSNENWSNL